MHSIPEPDTTQIVFIGRKNTGKSSLVNEFFGQEVSIVNDVPGTTTQSFYNLMEMLPYGPVVLVDTAGIDEAGDLSEKRISKTIKSISSADLAIVILDARSTLSNEEVELFFYLDKISVPYVVAVNKIEFGVNSDLLNELGNLKIVHYEISCKEHVGIEELKLRVMRKLPRDSQNSLFSSLLSKNSIVMFIIPDDQSTPQSKCINFQLNYIKEIISEDSICVIIKDKEIKTCLNSLNRPPDLIVTDSSIIKMVSSEIPESVKLTTFSLILGKQKGNLNNFSKSLIRIDELKDGDKVLISEACNYHNPRNDSGNNIFPEWIRAHTKKHIHFEILTGGDLPDNLGDYKLIVHCNGCMISRKEMQVRLNEASLLNIPVVSYGILAAYINGSIPRVLTPLIN